MAVEQLTETKAVIHKGLKVRCINKVKILYSHGVMYTWIKCKYT